jgi:cytochrome c-type protein NapB
MKAMSKITIGLVAVAVLMVGCNETTAKKPAKVDAPVTEASLGVRKTDLYSEGTTSPSKTSYGTAQAMSSSKIKRAFQDAPPMIPHDTTGMLPIKIGNNQCVGCHMPDMALSVGATPIPVSHFTNFRPTHTVKNGTFKKSIDNYKNEVSIKKTTKLQGARFNCSQCHAPQSQGKLAVENTFKATYTRKDGAQKSSWNADKYTADLKTLHGGDNFITKEDIANKNSAAGHLPH